MSYEETCSCAGHNKQFPSPLETGSEEEGERPGKIIHEH